MLRAARVPQPTNRSTTTQRLERCTPPLPEFERSVAFYQANGFEITGGYKMKLTLK